MRGIGIDVSRVEATATARSTRMIRVSSKMRRIMRALEWSSSACHHFSPLHTRYRLHGGAPLVQSNCMRAGGRLPIAEKKAQYSSSFHCSFFRTLHSSCSSCTCSASAVGRYTEVQHGSNDNKDKDDSEMNSFTRPFILGIETSCDDTCAAIVDARGSILAMSKRSQHHIHSTYGGVVPNLAMEAHRLAIDEVVETCIQEARTKLRENDVIESSAGVQLESHVAEEEKESASKRSGGAIWEQREKCQDGIVDAVAATIGPGLVLCLRVGVQKARQIAAESSLPFIPVHHMEAHTLVARIERRNRHIVKYPFVALLVSGGHNMLVLAKGLGRYVAGFSMLLSRKRN